MDYHQHRFDDNSLLIYKNEELIALFPANRVNKTVYSHQGLTYGGLIVSEKLKLKEFANCFKAALVSYKKAGFETLQLKQIPTIYNIVPNDELQYLTFILEGKLIKRDSLSVINLKHKPKVSKDRIAGKKRAIKQQLIIKETEDFSEFWNHILTPNLIEKYNVNPLHSLVEIELLKSRFPKQIRQFNVYDDGQIVAGTTIFETMHVAHSQYISGNEDKNSNGSLDFLHLHLIENVFKDKLYFDFSISNENQGKQINEGLNYWKEGFGARTITQDFYEINLDHISKLDTIFI